MIDPAALTPEEIEVLRRLAADPKKVGLSDAALMAIGEIQRQAIKEGFKEWLDATYAAVGKWTLRGMTALLFAGFIYLIAKTNGFGAVHLATHMAKEP